MRISGGKARDIPLKPPQRRGIRPTTDLTRQAIFSMLENTATRWGRVLDLFAGTGALGIEALSRGATWADFVDRTRRCCDAIRHNLEAAGFAGSAHVHCCSVHKALSLLDTQYDIIFVDPPYADESLNDMLSALAGSATVGDASTLVVCHSSRRPLAAHYHKLALAKQRDHGDTSISIFRTEA